MLLRERALGFSINNINIVIVITQYITRAGFSDLLLLFYVNCLEVSEIMLIFAPLKLQCGTSMPPS